MNKERKNNILIIEDEDSIRKFIRINLERNNFTVFEAGSGEEGIEIVRKENVNVVILDIMLPGIDGYEVCKILRKECAQIGIIMLTAKSQDIDKITGLEYGTDDYMAKPFNPIELVLRVKSLVRRMEFHLHDKSGVESDGPFKIDSYARKFYKDGREIELTPTEYSIIKLFMENSGKAFSRDEILNIVWGYDFVGDTKIVDVNIRRLRAKLEDDPSDPQIIDTVWGVGYRWAINKK
ncbi:response regulator transcription factor [Acidilutibacter cellobiosedens]|uniref:Response regulator transcription factor n=1 Tax=Acidilutibacter cellobiosedens TaxID=2507161 RepID=A0A410QDG1_9FIRM|nr:response regulator transcription factor [Acidilutibacter cellobiosedens]MBE6083410.1 response regulator transcription factor [Tissierellaceae bacterium]QAT62030.1 response regulator transcription factor [Acidilutibacter cellobiosedens]